MSPPALAAEIHPGHESCASFPRSFLASLAALQPTTVVLCPLALRSLMWVVEDFEVFRESSVIREGKGASLTEEEPLALTE